MQDTENRVYRFSIEEAEITAVISDDEGFSLTGGRYPSSVTPGFQVVEITAPRTVKVAVIGSPVLNGHPVEELLLEFCDTIHHSPSTTFWYVREFAQFIESKFRQDAECQKAQVRLLTESYCDDLLADLRAVDPHCTFATVIHSKASLAILKKAEELVQRWDQAETDRLIAETCHAIITKWYRKTIRRTLICASGEGGLTKSELSVLESMVRCRLLSDGFSSIKTSLCFFSREADGVLAMVKMETDGMFAGSIKAEIQDVPNAETQTLH